MPDKITLEEIDILENMFTGDKNRDASSSIRGFLFQDLIVIEKLLDDDVKYVCSEYLEDVDVFYEDGRLEIIQAKYYPNTEPKMEAIMTDLYYQYLRSMLMDSKLDIIPMLIIHRTQTVNKLNLEQLRATINPGLIQEPDELSDIKEWLIENVYSLNKEEQKNKLFTTYAYDSSIEDFLDIFDVIKKKNIEEYQAEIELKLAQKFDGANLYSYDSEKFRNIIFGLAITYVQRRYKIENPSFDNVCFHKEDFFEKINQKLQIRDENHIVSYLKSIAAQVLGDVFKYNEGLSLEQSKIINGIYMYTLEWLGELGSSDQGQLQLVNTLSDKSVEDIHCFVYESVDSRLLIIAECKRAIKQFLKYFWKIIYDRCLDKIDFDIKNDAEMMNPQTYIVRSEEKYICLNFPDDYANKSVLLSAEDTTAMDISRTKLCSKMMHFKPEKWFLPGDIVGKYEYDYSTAEIRQENSITSLEEDGFTIECMKCIKTNRGGWLINDDCKKCIFSQSCRERTN